MDTSPNSQWFYSQNGEQKGPISFSELQQHFLSDGLSASSLVWTEGQDNWVAASTIPGLITTADAESSNPYSAPLTDASLATEGGPIGEEEPPDPPIPLDIAFCISQGWKHTFANFGTIILLGLIYLGILIGLGVIVTLIETAINGGSTSLSYNPSDPGEFYQPTSGVSLISVVLEIISQIVALFLSMGATKVGLDLIKGRPSQVGDIFSQGDKLVNGIIASILFWIMLLIGFVLLIVPGIIVFIRFAHYQSAIVEKNLSGIDALKYSWNLTRGNGLSLFGLAILTFLIAVAGLLALVVGLIVAIPVVWLAQLIAYRYLHAGAQGIKVLS